MEVLEEARGKILKLEEAVDKACRCKLPPEITKIICREYVTNEQLIFERIILETCWNAWRNTRCNYEKFIDSYFEKLSKLKENCWLEYSYHLLHRVNLSDASLKYSFRQAVVQCYDRNHMCHRVCCFYNAYRACICVDPVIPSSC